MLFLFLLYGNIEIFVSQAVVGRQRKIYLVNFPADRLKAQRLRRDHQLTFLCRHSELQDEGRLVGESRNLSPSLGKLIWLPLNYFIVRLCLVLHPKVTICNVHGVQEFLLSKIQLMVIILLLSSSSHWQETAACPWMCGSTIDKPGCDRAYLSA